MLKMIFFWTMTFLVLVSCSATQMAPYDQYAYQKSIEVKVSASKLMDQAVQPYEDHKSEVEGLLLEIEKMKLYEQNRPNNGISLRMWQLLSDENKFLLAGLIKKWRDENQLSKTFIKEAKAQITEAMDILIRFEGSKDAKAKGNLEHFIMTNR